MKKFSVLGFAIAAIVSSAAVGDELQYGIRAGANYSDNVDRTPENERSSAAGVAGFDLRALRETGRLQYNAFGDMEYRDYFESGIESQSFGRVLADSSYAIAPETFEWLASASFDQIREDVLRPVSPGNLEEVIAFSTGPRVTGRFGNSMELQGDAHYAIADYSERDVDSNTLGALMALGRRVSERTFAGVGASYADVSYDTPPGATSADFERYEYFLRFRTEGARTEIDADVGYTEIAGAGLDADGPMARIRLTRRMTPALSGFLGYVREFPTSSEPTFTPQPIEGAVVGDASVLTVGPRENENFQLGVTFERPRTAASLMFSRRTETVLTVGSSDRTVDDVYASVSRLLTTRSTLSLYGTYTQDAVNSSGSEIESNETMLGARLNLVFGRVLSLDFIGQFRQRDSDSPSGEYEEFTGGIFLRYGSARRLGSEFAAP